MDGIIGFSAHHVNEHVYESKHCKNQTGSTGGCLPSRVGIVTTIIEAECLHTLSLLRWSGLSLTYNRISA